MSNAESTLSVATAARRRRVTRLVHFTPLQNVTGMVDVGKMLPRQALSAYACDHQDAYLLDYLRLNDDLRLDGRQDCLNLSIQHPNTFLFSRFRGRHTQCDLWVVIELSVTLLDSPGVLFTTGNAAATFVRRHGTNGGVMGFEALFADTVTVANYRTTGVIQRGNLPSCFPTDIQAEVLLPSPVPIDQISAFTVANHEHACRLKGVLRLTGAERLLERVKVDPVVFEERSV